MEHNDLVGLGSNHTPILTIKKGITMKYGILLILCVTLSGCYNTGYYGSNYNPALGNALKQWGNQMQEQVRYNRAVQQQQRQQWNNNPFQLQQGTYSNPIYIKQAPSGY